jgi:hypothetical protein
VCWSGRGRFCSAGRSRGKLTRKQRARIHLQVKIWRRNLVKELPTMDQLQLHIWLFLEKKMPVATTMDTNHEQHILNKSRYHIQQN